MLADILSRYWWMTLLRGLFWILFGIVLFARPGTGALTILWLIAVYTIAFGVVLLLLAFRVRRGVERIAGALGA
jgi:uncharacterized membrane protein HdeD (DUF308 family)